jgi:sugar phosphate isomerase/epimerase
VRFAICNELFEGWDVARTFARLAQIGYDGVELAPFTLAPRITDVSAPQRAAVRRAAAGAGIAVVGLHWLLAKTQGLHVAHPDDAVRRATVAYLEELVRACSDMGGELMVMGSPQQRNPLPGQSFEDAFARCADTFARVMPEAAARGVRICFEHLTRKETAFINTAAESRRLVQAVGHPNFVLHLDVKAMLGQGDAPVPELIRRFGAEAGHFHANDSNLLGPGMGPTDFVPIFRALKEVGYARWVSVEAFDFTPGAEKIAIDSLETMRRCRAVA